ncbi:hypothetical protein QBC34DRAFT_454665 [Podospora aff. communis PSN243]|uniref:Glycoside Hydrolase Family 93 n=1 Tax=Podospora aff. communis PSN243 TaxID=3040156 RepID=A0AAV9G0E7_9PEZI|nr:hypothetical protein QBC34DRAFT_454665 [Podospora aff. communis PSN243]
MYYVGLVAHQFGRTNAILMKNAVSNGTDWKFTPYGFADITTVYEGQGVAYPSVAQIGNNDTHLICVFQATVPILNKAVIGSVTSTDNGRNWKDYQEIRREPSGNAKRPYVANIQGNLVLTFQTDESSGTANSSRSDTTKMMIRTDGKTWAFVNPQAGTAQGTLGSDMKQTSLYDLGGGDILVLYGGEDTPLRSGKWTLDGSSASDPSAGPSPGVATAPVATPLSSSYSVVNISPTSSATVFLPTTITTAFTASTTSIDTASTSTILTVNISPTSSTAAIAPTVLTTSVVPAAPSTTQTAPAPRQTCNGRRKKMLHVV